MILTVQLAIEVIIYGIFGSDWMRCLTFWEAFAP